MNKLEHTVKQLGMALGFNLVGIGSAEPFFRDEQAALERIREGMMDGLPWYTEERVHKATHPEELLPGARSIISLAISYNNKSEVSHNGIAGRIARYAWGDDYHQVLKDKLKEFVVRLGDSLQERVRTRIFVDDGPMNDRAAAERAGIGWFGKNTNILTPSHGSWVLLGQVITDLDLVPDEPLLKNCGDCVRCIESCPTGAIVAPYAIDNRRCISFLTIELRGTIPRELRPLVGDWIFGCDICQDVCPVNREVPQTLEPAFKQRHDFAAPELLPLLSLDDKSFQDRFRNSPVKRAKRVGLQRNVCVALGNIADPIAIPALRRSLLNAETLVRVHAAWALGRIGTFEAADALNRALNSGPDLAVKAEIEQSLMDLHGNVGRV
ncbi:MAG: tRNA epoxyqueuosine(34) reductase QueG [SAR202 cluster bacterium]|jgi:epoxyqueuosine reductase|nr:tRNA epoxyqueuosine(34) reductase QueG [SAR202 cluster bacterium]